MDGNGMDCCVLVPVVGIVAITAVELPVVASSDRTTSHRGQAHANRRKRTRSIAISPSSAW